MAQQPKVVKMGPGRNAGPRPKVENPGKVFKRILAYVMKQYKFQVILVLCCILLGVFAQVQGTLFMQTLIDSYILPLLVLSDQKKYTIQIAIKNFIGNTGVDWSSILAASVLSILPIVILFMILQKYIVGCVSAGGVKG